MVCYSVDMMSTRILNPLNLTLNSVSTQPDVFWVVASGTKSKFPVLTSPLGNLAQSIQLLSQLGASDDEISGLQADLDIGKSVIAVCTSRYLSTKLQDTFGFRLE